MKRSSLQVKFLIAFYVAISFVFTYGCHQRMGGYTAVSSISKKGFARNREQLLSMDGQQVNVWGYVDHSNMYGDQKTRALLGEWWGGDGPTPNTWRFDLKGEAGDRAGHSIQVIAPNDGGRDALLRAFSADARAEKPTRVFLTGKLRVFDAPTNFRLSTGFFIEVGSTDAIRLDLPK